jgi:hypothetical protein
VHIPELQAIVHMWNVMSIPTGFVVVAGWNVIDKTGAMNVCMTVYANSCSDQCTARARWLTEVSSSITM